MRKDRKIMAVVLLFACMLSLVRYKESEAAWHSCKAWKNNRYNNYWAVTQTSSWHTSLTVELWKHKGKSDQRRLAFDTRYGDSSSEFCSPICNIKTLGLAASDLDAAGEYFCK